MVGGVADPVQLTARELGRDQPQQLPGQLDRAGGTLARPQPEQHRQAHRGGAERQPDHDPGHHPPVPPRDLPTALGRAVVGPERGWVRARVRWPGVVVDLPGEADGVLLATGGHPFWDAADREWGRRWAARRGRTGSGPRRRAAARG